MLILYYGFPTSDWRKISIIAKVFKVDKLKKVF